MSETAVPIDPFDASVLDETTELRALRRALELAEGFTLLFARCNLYDQRQRLIAALKARLPSLNIQEIYFRESIPHLLDALREQIAEPAPDAVFVSGLENSLPTAADAQNTPFVANLNASRNSFSRVVPCPLVLWIPEYVLVAVVRGAPDFFSVRSGVYFFASTPEESIDFVSGIVSSEIWREYGLSMNEKNERIDSIQSLLEDYRSIPNRDYVAEARLFTRLGALYLSLGQWRESEAAYQQALAVCRRLNNLIEVGTALNNLGVVYERQGKWAEAESVYQQSLAFKQITGNHTGEGQLYNNLAAIYCHQSRWSEAEACLEQSLLLVKESKDRNGEAATLLGFGNFYTMIGQLKKAEEHYKQSLGIFRELGDLYGEALVLNSLGFNCRLQGKFVDAISFYQHSLVIYNDIGDPKGKSGVLNNIANVYIQQGRLPEAEDCYMQSVAIDKEIGNRVGEGRTLSNLAGLHAVQQDLAGAINLGNQALSMLEETQDEGAKVKMRELLFAWEKQLGEHPKGE